MSYKVKFGESYLSDYCSVLNVNRSLLPDRSNFSKQIPVMDGSYFTGCKYNERIISLEVAIFANTKEEYAKKVEKLANVLKSRNVQKLIIEDEPYKAYYAVVDGSTSLSKVYHNGTSIISFICHDPFAESLYWNSYMANSNGIFDVKSYGTENAYPVVDVDFKSKGCFFQLTNYKGQTILVGKPKQAQVPTITESDKIVDNPCQLIGTFSDLSSSLLDEGRIVNGKHSIGLEGEALVCSNFGSSQAEKWTGVASKLSTGQNLSEFEVTVDFVFSSEGKNYVTPEPQKPTPAPPAPTPSEKPNNNTTKPPAECLGTYKVVNCGGLWINGSANTDNPLYAMAPGTLIYPTEISGNWAKHTHSNKWNTFTGWSSMKYLQKVSNDQSGKKSMFQKQKSATTFNFAEEQLGMIEVYGYDQNGAKLFKMQLSDNNKYYEYVEPKAFIGNSLVLEDGKNTPAPRKVDVKNDKGEVTGQEEVESGVFGDYNDFNGKISIKREKNTKGQDLWSCEVQKIENGKVVKTMSTQNSLSSEKYPKGNLSYIGIYTGKYDTSAPVSVMGVKHIEIRRLNVKTDESTNSNVQIFQPGDHLHINFEDGIVMLNDKNALPVLDIGSEFFTVPPGESQFLFATDADNTSAVCGFKDKFI